MSRRYWDIVLFGADGKDVELLELENMTRLELIEKCRELMFECDDLRDQIAGRVVSPLKQIVMDLEGV